MENYFKAFLTEKGLSQYKVAQQTGFTATTVNRWYKGSSISKACLYRLKSVYPDFDTSKIKPDMV